MKVKEIFKFPNEIVSRLKGSKSFALFKSPISMVDNDTFVGIEVEVERVGRQAPIFKLPDGGFLWGNTEDGSLRNNGREFVSIPVKGDEIVFALDRLYTQLNKDPNCVNHEFTSRTGLHIHMDAREMQEHEVFTFIQLYVMVEDFLYAYAGHGRKNNIFCVPLKDADKMNVLAQTFDKSHPYNEWRDLDIRALPRIWTKYVGFNLLPLSKYGTIEFRHLSGTKDYESILVWINLILCLKNYVTRKGNQDLMNKIDTLNTSSEYLGFLQEVFGNYLKYIPLDNPEAKIEQSIIRLKALQANFTEGLSHYCQKDTLTKLEKHKIDTNSKFFNFLVHAGYIKPFKEYAGNEKKSGATTISDDEFGARVDENIARILEQHERDNRIREVRAAENARVVRRANPPAPEAQPRIDLNDIDF